MCPCKKNSRLEQLLKNLEGFFEYVGSPQSGSRALYEEVYEDLLTSLYQLDDGGNKVVIDWDNDSSSFLVDVTKPVYVGSYKDNSDSTFVTSHGRGIGNSYNDIVNYGFKSTIKPISYDFPDSNIALRSFIIDADEDSVLPISYNKDSDECEFTDVVRALCLPRVNFYVYGEYDSSGNLLPQYNGHFNMKRNGYSKVGYCSQQLNFENTGAIDQYGNIIKRARLAVLMLPIHNSDSSKFELYGHTDGFYGDYYDTTIEKYTFDSSVDYGEEVEASGVNGLVHINFVNADSNYADLVPTDSCQFLGTIYNEVTENGESASKLIAFGNKWLTGNNDAIYCNKSGSLSIKYDRKTYIGNPISSYIGSVFSIDAHIYNTRFPNRVNPTYLYNTGSSEPVNIASIGDTVELGVKRLPVLDLTGELSDSDFDSMYPYIYAELGDKYVYLYEYDIAISNINIVLQISNVYMEYSGSTNPITFSIVDSSTAPGDTYVKNREDVHWHRVVCRVECQSAKFNENIQHTVIK